MKKLSFIAAAVLAATLTFTACDDLVQGFKDGYNSAIVNSVEDSTKDFEMGTVENNVYSSNFGGIKITAPDGWIFATEEEIMNAMQVGSELVGGDKADLYAELSKKTTITDMICQNPANAEGVMVMFENTSLNRISTAEKYIEALETGFKQLTDMTYSQVSNEKITLAGKEFQKAVFSISAPSIGLETSQIYYVAKVDDFMMVVCASKGLSEEDPARMESFITENK